MPLFPRIAFTAGFSVSERAIWNFKAAFFLLFKSFKKTTLSPSFSNR